MDKSDRAAAYFSEGFSCAQAVFAAFSEEEGLATPTALRLSEALGGGIAGQGMTCGAVTGALLAIGLKHGRTDGQNLAAKATTRELSRQFMERFETRHGSIQCQALLSLNIGTADGLAEARERGLFQSLCPVFVRDAAALLEEML